MIFSCFYLGWRIYDLGWCVYDLGWRVHDLGCHVSVLGWHVCDLGWRINLSCLDSDRGRSVSPLWARYNGDKLGWHVCEASKLHILLKGF